MPYSTPLMFTSIIRSHSSILRRSSGDCGIRPALLINTSMRPCACTALSTNFFTCSLWITSIGTASAFPPRRMSSSASDLMRSARRAPSTTLAPSAERNRAVASPSPLLAPVITTTFPSMLLLMTSIAVRESVLLENILGYGNGGHRAGPAGVKRQVSDSLDQLVLRHAVFARSGEVRAKLVRAVHRDESADSNQAAIPQGQSRTRPHIPKQHVVSELGQFGGDVAEHSLGRRRLHIGTRDGGCGRVGRGRLCMNRHTSSQHHGSGGQGTCNELFHDFSPMLAQLKRELPQVAVLLVGDFLHPVDHLSVEFLLDRDMGHRGGGRCAMPMLLAWRAPDHVAGSDDLDGAAPALHKTAAGCHDERLTQRMRVPIASRAWLERYVGAARARRFGRLEQLVNAYRAGEILGRSSRGGLRAVWFDVHLQVLCLDARQGSNWNAG